MLIAHCVWEKRIGSSRKRIRKWFGVGVAIQVDTPKIWDPPE